MRIWLIVVALVAAACSETPSDGCPEAYLIGVRGSGQEPGVGPQVADLYDQFAAELGGSAELIALDYPAAQGRFGNPSVYTASVEAGIAALPGAIASAPCPDAAIVLAGYSQGAHVITLAEVDVDAVVLLASPVFDPRDDTAKSGDFDPDRGGVIDRVPVGSLADRTIQVCLNGDPVCQQGALAFWVHSWGYAGGALADAAAFAALRV